MPNACESTCFWLYWLRYVWNNPLIYTDPDGEWIFTVLAAIFAPPLLPLAISTDIGWITGGISSTRQGQSFWSGAWKGAVTGAISGATSFIGVPGIIPGGILQSGISVGVNGITNSLNGDDFFDNWGIAAISGFASGAYNGYQLSDANGLNYWWGTEQSNWGHNRNQWSLAWWDKPDVYTFQADNPNIVNINNFQCDGTSFSSTHGNTNEYWQNKLDARGKYEPYTRVYANEGLDYQIGRNMQDIQNYYSQGYDRLHLRVTEYGPSADYHRMVVREIRHVPNKKLIFKVYDPGAGVIINGGSPNFRKTYNVFKSVNFRFNEFVLFR